MRIKSRNPVLSKVERYDSYASASYQTATYAGVAGKSVFFVLLALIGALVGVLSLYKRPEVLGSGAVVIFIVTAISGFVAFLVPRASKVAGTIYSFFEGMLLGVISLLFEMVYPGAVIGALLGTASVVLVVSTLYFSALVKVNGKFLKFVFIAAISFILTQLLLFILGLIIPNAIEPLVSNTGVQLLFCGISVLFASFSLLIDLEQVRMIVEGGQPKEMEWYVAFGIAYSILWIYIEMLRIIAIILSKKD